MTDRSYRIGLIRGDGVGPEVTRAARSVRWRSQRSTARNRMPPANKATATGNSSSGSLNRFISSASPPAPVSAKAVKILSK